MLFSTFPREVGPPRKLVNNKKEYLEYINLYNGKRKAIYSSIYTFEKLQPNTKNVLRPIYDTAIVDKIYFDFDNKSCSAYIECNKLHKHCDKMGLKHCIIFSGRGYHLYIFTKSSNLKYKKEAIKGAQNFFINASQLIVDKQVIGNVAQMARIPNTFHIKAKRFCIPLSREQFEKGSEFIKEFSKEQNFTNNIYIGRKLLHISDWDAPYSGDNFLFSPIENITSSTKIKKFPNFPLCISYIIHKIPMRWKERYLLILYLKEKGFLQQEVFEILKEYLSDKKLRHCIKEERQLQYLFKRDDLLFPSCENMMKDGFCPGKCKLFGKVIYK